MVGKKLILYFFIVVSLAFSNETHAIADLNSKVVFEDPYFTDFKEPNKFINLVAGFPQTVQSGDIFSFGYKNFQGKEFWKAILPACSTNQKTYCIKGFFWRKKGESTWKAGSVSDWKPIDNDPQLNFCSNGPGCLPLDPSKARPKDDLKFANFTMNESGFLPFGGLPTVWNLPGANHGGGSQYLVNVSFEKNLNMPSSYANNFFKFQIVPVNYLDKPVNNFPTDYDGNSYFFWKYVFPNNYGDRYPFPENIEFKLDLNVGKFFSSTPGFIIAEVRNFKVSHPKVDELILSGSPEKYLLGKAGPFSCDEIPQGLLYDCQGGYDAAMIEKVGTTFDIDRYLTRENRDYFKALIKYFLPYAYIDTFSGSASPVVKLSDCQFDSAKDFGYSSSNAMAYTFLPPAWNMKMQTLEYELGSIHENLEGERNYGVYDLSLPISTAKCLWGLDPLKAKVQISVISNDGTNEIFSSTYSSDKTNVYFRISGMSFSSPTVKIKLLAIDKSSKKSTTNQKGKK